MTFIVWYMIIKSLGGHCLQTPRLCENKRGGPSLQRFIDHSVFLYKKNNTTFVLFFFFLLFFYSSFLSGLRMVFVGSEYNTSLFWVVCIANISPILWFSFSIIAQSWLTVISPVFSVESGSPKNNDSFFSHSHSCYFSFKPYCTGNSLQSNYNNDDMYNHFVLILICWVHVNQMNQYYCFWRRLDQILCASLCYVSN